MRPVEMGLVVAAPRHRHLPNPRESLRRGRQMWQVMYLPYVERTDHPDAGTADEACCGFLGRHGPQLLLVSTSESMNVVTAAADSGPAVVTTLWAARSTVSVRAPGISA